MSYTIKSRTGRELHVAKDAADVRAALVDAASRRADLQGADLQGAYLQGAYLRRADLQGADLQGAYLQGAYLRRADLQGADLQGADLQGAYLRGADLQGADLQGADLQGAYLRRADLQGAHNLNPHRSNELLMLRDQVGKVRAYKLVTESGEGPYYGGIAYEKGETYEVKDANTDDLRDCGAGINLGTLPWCCENWQPGYRILVVEFRAKDIAAIPHGGKFRVSRCKVVGEKSLDELGLA